MLGNKRILAELAMLKQQLDRMEKMLGERDKIEGDSVVNQFMGENGLYSYKTLEDKLKDKYLKQHN